MVITNPPTTTGPPTTVLPTTAPSTEPTPTTPTSSSATTEAPNAPTDHHQTHAFDRGTPIRRRSTPHPRPRRPPRRSNPRPQRWHPPRRLRPPPMSAVTPGVGDGLSEERRSREKPDERLELGVVERPRRSHRRLPVHQVERSRTPNGSSISTAVEDVIGEMSGSRNRHVVLRLVLRLVGPGPAVERMPRLDVFGGRGQATRGRQRSVHHRLQRSQVCRPGDPGDTGPGRTVRR